MADEAPPVVSKLPSRPLTVDEGQALEEQESASSWVRPESILLQEEDHVVIVLAAVNRDAGHVWLLGYSPDVDGWVVVDEWRQEEIEHDLFYARLDEWEEEIFAGRAGWTVG